jgi:hypothetical protein
MTRRRAPKSEKFLGKREKDEVATHQASRYLVKSKEFSV